MKATPHVQRLIIAIATLFVGTLLSAQTVTLTMNPQTITGSASSYLYGINLSKGKSLSVATNADYKARLHKIGSGVFRYHGSIGTGAWLNATKTGWDATTINQVLSEMPISTKDAIITIQGWPGWMDADSDGLLDAVYYDDFASLCASLVQVVNGQLGMNIRYWEPTNEKNNVYTTTAHIQELAQIFDLCSQSMKAVDSSIQVVGGAWSWGSDWKLKTFLDSISTSSLDVWSYHTYTSFGSVSSIDAALANVSTMTTQLNYSRTELNNRGFSSVPIWVDEFNVIYSWTGVDGVEYMSNYIGAVHDALVFQNVIADDRIEALFAWTDAEPAFGKMAPDYQSLRPSGHLFHLMKHNLIEMAFPK